MRSPKTHTVVASRLHTGKMTHRLVTVVALAMLAKTSPQWNSVSLSAMHMLNVLDSTCVIPVVGARTGSRDLSILSQVRATTVTARTPTEHPGRGRRAPLCVGPYGHIENVE